MIQRIGIWISEKTQK